MAEPQPIKASVPSDVSVAPATRPRPNLKTIGFGLALALAIVVGAWLIGGRLGFDQIGQGGVNLSLLPKAGDPAPDFVTIVSDGRLVQLSGFRGQPVWLNFWGSWCPPCRSEMPEMQAAYEALAPRGLVMLAVSLDEPPDVAFEYAELNGATYLVASDPQRVATGPVYPIANFPTHILIDGDGIVREVIFAELNKDQFIEHAAKILPPDEGNR